MKLQQRGLHRFNDLLNNLTLRIDEQRDRTHKSRESARKMCRTLS
jgi:hypothetical protein